MHRLYESTGVWFYSPYLLVSFWSEMESISLVILFIFDLSIIYAARNMLFAMAIYLIHRSYPTLIKSNLSGFNILVSDMYHSNASIHCTIFKLLIHSSSPHVCLWYFFWLKWGQLLSVTTFTLTFFVNQSYSLWRKCMELSRRLQGSLHYLIRYEIYLPNKRPLFVDENDCNWLSPSFVCLFLYLSTRFMFFNSFRNRMNRPHSNDKYKRETARCQYEHGLSCCAQDTF